MTLSDGAIDGASLGVFSFADFGILNDWPEDVPVSSLL